MEAHIRINLTLTLILVLAVSGCRVETLTPAAREIPEPDPRPGVATVSWSVHTSPIAPSTRPEGASLSIGAWRRRLGPRNGWSATLEAELRAPFLLRVAPFGGSRPYHGLRRVVDAGDPRPLEMPLLPRTSLGGEPYAELLDLLQEFLAPWSGSRVQRWEGLPRLVQLPDLAPDDPYRFTCEQALEIWNEAAGRSCLRVTASPESASVRCTVFETDRAAFTRAEARDEAGNPLRLRVHLSRRWLEEYPRYVRRVWVHEFGHALGLWGHSRDLDHVVNGRAVLTDRPHPQEVAALHLLYRLPRGFDLGWIQRHWPPRRPPLPCPVDSADIQIPRQQILGHATGHPPTGQAVGPQQGREQTER